MILTRPLLVLVLIGTIWKDTVASKNIHNCSECVTTTRRGRVTSQTLIYHTVYECKGTIIGYCIHNQTQYGLCNEGESKIVCFNPKELPYQYWVEIRTNSAKGRLMAQSQIIANLSHPV